MIVALSCISIGTEFTFSAVQAQNTSLQNSSSKESSSPLSSDKFAFSLFSTIAKQHTGENLLISPFSVYTALSMVLLGSADSTRSQIASVLGISTDKIRELSSQNKRTMQRLLDSKAVQLDIASGIFADSQTKFKKNFLDQCHKDFDAELKNVNFKSAETLNTINNWCSEKTHGKINKLLSELPPLTIMVLLNAIYFKGTWQHKFDKAFTVDDKFRGAAGKTLPVKMMSQTQDFEYLKEKNFDMVCLPYQDKDLAMFILLPHKGMDIDKVQIELSQANWQKWKRAVKTVDVHLSLPRFRVEFSAKLKEALKAMGIIDAFSPGRANFSPMTEDAKAYIGSVVQKAYMDVTEQGTEAAAATAVTMLTRSAMMRPEPVEEFRVDHPFFVLLADQKSEEILFVAKVLKP
jgi:serpin B